MYDLHSHTSFSDDCNSSMDSMILSAIEKGLEGLAITDHYDPDYPDLNFPFEIDFPKYHKALLDAQNKYSDKIKIIKGLEVGLQKGETLKKCKETVTSFSYDFIIGSFHCFNGIDLYTANYRAMDKNKILPNFYEYMHDVLKDYSDYDVIGHFNVIDRYLYFEPDYNAYKTSFPIIEDLLRNIINNGKGIEINTSSYRYGMGEKTTPSSEILEMYKSLGGEILTIGADAHNPRDVGYGFDKAIALAKKYNFRYISTYKNRNVKMIKL